MSITRNFITVGAGTAASRLLGFGRDVTLAAVLGSGPVADAFFVAFRLPNLFRRIFSEGAFNAAFIPLFSRLRDQQGEAGALAFSARVLTVMSLVTAALSVVMMAVMPLVVLVLAPGFQSDADKFALTVLMTRIAFPYLLFMMVTAFFSALLNAKGQFAAAAFAPVLLNIVLIIAVLPLAAMGEKNHVTIGMILAVAVLLAGVLQAALCWVAAWRAGLTLPLAKPSLDEGMMQLWRLGVPGIVAGGISQINIVVGTTIASLEPSAVSWLYYADRLYQLPLGIVGVSMGVVLLPDMVAKLHKGQDAALAHTQNRAVEAALALSLPATVGLFLLAGPMISVLFERGAFTALDTAKTAAALKLFGLGLPAFVLVKVFSSIFFARENTVIPMRSALWSVSANVVLSVGLYPFFGHLGIAAATSIAGWGNVGLLWLALRRDGLFTCDATAARAIPLVMASAVIMGAVLIWLEGLLPDTHHTLSLALLIAAGMLAYALATWATGAIDWKALLRKAERDGS